MVAIHNQQSWGRDQRQSAMPSVRRRRRASAHAPIRLNWLRIGVLAGLAAFWSGVAMIVFRLI
jgi:hypothetical protein